MYECSCSRGHQLGPEGFCTAIPLYWTPAKLFFLVCGCVALTLLAVYAARLVFKRQKKLRHNLELHEALLEESQQVYLPLPVPSPPPATPHHTPPRYAVPHADRLCRASCRPMMPGCLRLTHVCPWDKNAVFCFWRAGRRFEVLQLKKAWEIEKEQITLESRIDGGVPGAFGEVWMVRKKAGSPGARAGCFFVRVRCRLCHRGIHQGEGPSAVFLCVCVRMCACCAA